MRQETKEAIEKASKQTALHFVTLVDAKNPERTQQVLIDWGQTSPPSGDWQIRGWHPYIVRSHAELEVVKKLIAEVEFVEGRAALARQALAKLTLAERDALGL